MVRPLWVRALVGALGVVLLLALLLAGLRAAHWHGFPFD
jgi:hypothetical protein